MQKTIATLDKNSSERIQVDLTEYNGRDLASLRVYYRASIEPEEWKPTKKGLSVRIGMLPQVIAALREAEAEARSAGLFEGVEGHDSET